MSQAVFPGRQRHAVDRRLGAQPGVEGIRIRLEFRAGDVDRVVVAAQGACGSMIGINAWPISLRRSQTGRCCLRSGSGFERVAKDLGAGAAEPAVEESGVDPAEVGVVLQVAGVELVGGQAGVRADDAPLDGRAGHEEAGGCAVVGPFAAVLLDAAAEFREGHEHHAAGVPRALELGEEASDGVGDLLEQLLMPLELVGVGVEARLREVEEARAEPGGDQAAHQVEVLRQLATAGARDRTRDGARGGGVG